MRLDPDPVELPLDRRPAGGGERIDDAVGRRGEHRLHRAQHLQSHRAQAVLAVPQGDRGRPAEVTGQHRGAAHGGRGNARGARDGLGDEADQSALSDLAGEQAADEVCLVCRRFGEQFGEDRGSRLDGAGSRRREDAVERGVEVRDREGRDCGRCDVGPVRGRPADPDPALPRLSGEEADGRLDLVGSHVTQQVGDQRDLAVPRGSLRD